MTSPLHDDQDLNAAVRSWLHEGDEPTPDRNRHIGRIMGRVDETKQRRRLWPLSPFGRRAVHSAAGAEGVQRVAGGRTAVLAPAPVMTALALTLIVASGLVWVASQPWALSLLPGAPAVDSADLALYERFRTLWAGRETDWATTEAVYAEDAVHSVLWLDAEEVVSGRFDLWSRMLQSAEVDGTAVTPIRLPEGYFGEHRYLLVPSTEVSDGLAGTACVIWIEDAQVTRHDCILPMSTEDETLPTLLAPDETATAEREALMTARHQAGRSNDREALEAVVSPDIEHHVLSQSQVYTLQGVDEYWAVFGGGGVSVMEEVDLPAPEGELRWANFSHVGGGALCVWHARDGLITRHDCIVPGSTTVSSAITEISAPPDG